MPIYEYRCQKCGEKFEVRQKFADAPVTTHEGCGGAVERLLSAPSFHLKGSGWYATDYAKGSSRAESKPSDSKAESKTETKAGANGGSKSETTDTKPAAETKTESKTESPAPKP